MDSFETLGLSSSLLQAITDLGYQEPTSIQQRAIPVMISGQDVLGQAQTGTGKTAAFGLPLLNNLDAHANTIQALVMTPTRELAMQVSDSINLLGKHCRVKVLPVYGGQSYDRQLTQLKKGVQIVVGTPGRLLDLIHRGALDLSHVRQLILDEADEMLEMGFLEEVEEIIRQIPAERQTALFSATLPSSIRRIASQYMHDPQEIIIQAKKLTVDNTEQRHYLMRQDDKIPALIRLFETESIQNALIFTRTKAGAAELADVLMEKNFPVEALHGDLKQEAREKVLSRFRKGLTKILVATDVAARGLDIQNVSHVFNFDLPYDPEDYVHRIGRTGRAGKSGIAISFVTPREKNKLREIEAYASCSVPRAKLPEIKDILARREEQFTDKLVARLAMGESEQFQGLVAQIIEYGYDPVQIAAAAIQMVREADKQPALQDIHPIESAQKNRPFETNKPRSAGTPHTADRKTRRYGKESHEPGMVRLSINMGKEHNVRPSSLVGAIASRAGIPGSAIGAIVIHQQDTYLDVSKEYADVVVRKMVNWKIQNQPVIIRGLDR
jgi:ATP-dependent RNA helicase DeaD